MSNAASSIVQRRLHEAQKHVLKMAGKLDDRQLRRCQPAMRSGTRMVSERPGASTTRSSGTGGRDWG